MSYARITFNTSTPAAGLVLKTTARVSTGESNIANLTNVGSFYTTDTGVTTSEIVGDTNADKWSLVYPTSLPSDNTLPTVTLSAPCLTSGKTKYVRFIIASSAGAFTEPANGAGTLYNSTTSYSIYAQGLSSIDASGNCTNLSWRNSNGTQATIIKGTLTYDLYSIEMSWSKRHLFITSTLGNNCYFAAIEFPETLLTSLYSTAVPALYMTGPATSTLSSLTANSTAAAHVHNILNLYNPVTLATVGVRALTPTSNHTARIQSDALYGFGPNNLFTYSDNTTGSYYISPIIHDDFGFGNNYLDLSVYSNMYIAPSDSNTYGTKYVGNDGITYKGIIVYDNARTSTTIFMVKYG